MNEQNFQEERMVLPAILKFVAVACVVVGLIAAMELPVERSSYFEHRNTGATILWAAGGIVNGVLWWSLSYIVEACQRYINNDENNPK